MKWGLLESDKVFDDLELKIEQSMAMLLKIATRIWKTNMKIISLSSQVNKIKKGKLQKSVQKSPMPVF